MATTPNVILDTTHFLEDNIKYCLITYDVESLYTALKTAICKKHCMHAFSEYRTSNKYDFKITSKDFKQLLDLCLDYSLLKI